MRHMVICMLGLFGVIGVVCAQDLPKLGVSPSKNYLFVCRSKEAMQKVMKSGAGLGTNPIVVDKLVKSGDCLLAPYEYIKTIGYATDNGDGPAPITMEMSGKNSVMWGYPLDD